MSIWQVQEAKARFSEHVKKAETEGPQDITLHGRPVAVLLSQRQYESLSGRHQSLVEFMQKAPFPEVELDLTRQQDTAPEIPW